MKHTSSTALIAGVFFALPAATFAPAARATEPVPLGHLDGFYRHTAVLDRTLAGGGMLWDIPDWMTETDFPYVKKTFPTEAPFADGLTLVRLLGGWRDPSRPDDRREDPDDLVTRDADGRLRYRWDLLKARLDPYVTRGYDLTLVLDNIPFALARHPKVENFGQVSPPADWQEWHNFVRALCEELVRLYGQERAGGFRFRLGTEMQDERRWDGTFEDYLHYYDYAAKAVREVLPAAGFGPFNRSIPRGSYTTFDQYVGGNVSLLALSRHAATSLSRATGETSVPFDFVSRSLYYFSSFDEAGRLINVHPDERLPELKWLWDEIEKQSPRFRDLPREVHELGPHLQTEGGLYGLDTGARGAAQTFETLVGLREIGADRVWHWEVFETVLPGKTLLMSQGWLYSVLDRMRGGQAWVLPVSTVGSGSEGASRKALLSVNKDETILVVANWHPDRVVDSAARLEVDIPEALLDPALVPAGSVNFDETSSVFDRIRADLAHAGLLAPKHVAHRGRPATTLFTPGYASMAANPAATRSFVRDRWDGYQRLMIDSLKLKDAFPETTRTEGKVRLSFETATPSVSVFVWRRAPVTPAPAAAGSVPTPPPASKSLGRLDPFWRYSAVLGPFHEQGQGLYQIPEYVRRGELAYQPRPHRLEVPFADHLSVVRLLGGFNPRYHNGDQTRTEARDLVYRDTDGRLQYRFELLDPRLRPYLEQGYTSFTFVLDNVPWALPEAPAHQSLGQHMPPADMEEWREFVRRFCLALRTLLPPEAIADIRFRVGTEMNDPRRFDGPPEAFDAFYAASVAAVRSVFPTAKIGPFNIAGASIHGIERAHNINTRLVAERNLRSPNPHTGEPTPAVDWIAFTRYFTIGADLGANARQTGEVWRHFEERLPELGEVSREIHEFGVAPFGEQNRPDALVSSEPGALGAAATAVMILRLREAGVDRLWHWAQGNLVDSLRDRRGKLRNLFTGIAWLYQALEYARGGESHLLEPVSSPSPTVEALGLLSVREDRRVLLLAAYDRTLAGGGPRTVDFVLPAGTQLDVANLRLVRLNETTAPHRLLREHLREAGLLQEDFLGNPARLGSIRQMGVGRPAEEFIGDRLGAYEEAYTSLLGLRAPGPGELTLLDGPGGERRLRLTLSIPEVVLVSCPNINQSKEPPPR